jgi:uncharacterized protein (DUF2235 family)
MKRLIAFADGTWNTFDQPFATNVTKLCHQVVQVDDHGITQRAYHQHGVGTGHALDRILGGALGWGLDDNIINIYRWLVRQYEPDDELWLFGFSRGAYTARSVAGLLRNCGIVRQERHIGRAMEIYRQRDNGPDTDEAVRFRKRYAHDVRVKFIGVWDTVGSLGIPTTGINLRHRFHDVRLSSFVQNARHAVAIDEQRRPFEPTLWNNDDHPSLKQAWFVGAHSNVGGGLEDERLSDIALHWMMGEAQACGLGLRCEDQAENNPRAEGEIHYSHGGIYQFRARRRLIENRWNQVIHNSAIARLDADETYQPSNLIEAIDHELPTITSTPCTVHADESQDEDSP